MPAPKGNQNAHKGMLWRNAINRALARKGRELDPDGDGPAHERGLLIVAEKFIAAAAKGEAWALKDLGDRMDGKPAQAIDLNGELSIPVSGTVKFVNSSD